MKYSVRKLAWLAACSFLTAPGWCVAQSPQYVEPVVIDVPQLPRPERSAGKATEELPPVSNGLTLSQLQALAEANNPSLREASAYISAAQGRWIQSGLAPNPVAGYSGQQIGSRGLAEQQGVMIGQQIVTGGKLRLHREVLAQEVQVARQNYEIQRLRVFTDVSLNFYQAFAAQRRAEVTQQLVAISQEAVATMESLIRANEGTKIELLQARVESENTRILSLQAANRVTASWRSLGAVVGNLGPTVQPLEGALDEFPRPGEFETVFEQLASVSPEIGAARARVERARWAHQLARRERLGNLDVQGIVQKDEGVNLYDGALQMSMPLPVWDRKQGRIAETWADIAAAEQAEERLRLELRQRLAVAYEQYTSADQEATRYAQQILPAAEEQFRLVLEAKKAGEVNYTTVLIAQRTLAQSRLAYLEALLQRATAASEIQGMLLSGSLQAVPTP